MPYFYKVSDLFENKSLIDTLQFTISDFVVGCNKTPLSKSKSKSKSKSPKKNSVVILIFNLEGTNIHPHKHEYEYFTENKVSFERLTHKFSHITEEDIVEKYKLSEPILREVINFLSIVNKDEDISNLYMHITCNNKFKSIEKKGLLSEKKILPHMRIGDRMDAGDKTKKTMTKKSSTKKIMHRKFV